ncbi:hypothetical protein P5673_019300 [Acropora cervicornis]|uniref:Uncharacterized protein n=1 Tax=Acropora cervicornis TaxID=6130 RepID=A0AAD9V2B8_ACRCE|nr:hypothetical protein P5673_019300 [Acropora cervicornis]
MKCARASLPKFPLLLPSVSTSALYRSSTGKEGRRLRESIEGCGLSAQKLDGQSAHISRPHNQSTLHHHRLVLLEVFSNHFPILADVFFCEICDWVDVGHNKKVSSRILGGELELFQMFSYASCSRKDENVRVLLVGVLDSEAAGSLGFEHSRIHRYRLLVNCLATPSILRSIFVSTLVSHVAGSKPVKSLLRMEAPARTSLAALKARSFSWAVTVFCGSFVVNASSKLGWLPNVASSALMVTCSRVVLSGSFVLESLSVLIGADRSDKSSNWLAPPAMHHHFWKKKEAQVHRRAGKRSIKDSSDYFHPKFTRKEKRPR